VNSDTVAVIALNNRIRPALVRAVAREYAATPDVERIAAVGGLTWQTVHLVVFDLKRAGELPRRWA